MKNAFDFANLLWSCRYQSTAELCELDNVSSVALLSLRRLRRRRDVDEAVSVLFVGGDQGIT
jgi:hypothetical protein